jgi:hypothetical protein
MGQLDSIATALAVLAVIALGLSAGAMVAEGAVLVPWWRSMPPELFLRWYAENASRLFDVFGSLEIAGAVVAVGAGALYRHQRCGSGGFYVGSAVLAAAVLAGFPLFFQQVNASFAAGTITIDRVAPELGRWAMWHWARTGIGIAAFATAVLGLRAGGRDGRPTNVPKTECR